MRWPVNSAHGRKDQGFTILELMVVIVLIAGFMAMMITSVRSIIGVELKSEVTKIAGLMNGIFDKAIQTGKTHRIIFDLEDNSYWVEEEDIQAGEYFPNLGYEELFKSAQERSINSSKNGQIRTGPKYKKVANKLGEKYKLPKDMSLYGAWTEDMIDISRENQVALYFFRDGMTQTSFVSIALKEKEEESKIYVSLSPLTGQTFIEYGEPDLSELKNQNEPR